MPISFARLSAICRRRRRARASPATRAFRAARWLAHPHGRPPTEFYRAWWKQYRQHQHDTETPTQIPDINQPPPVAAKHSNGRRAKTRGLGAKGARKGGRCADRCNRSGQTGMDPVTDPGPCANARPG
jgi:hypothetical protein